MKFILTCGGTAGHINPALAVAGRLKELLPGSEFLFIGAEGKMEMQLVPREGYEIKALKITNLRRSFKPQAIAHNLKTVKNVLASLTQARKIIKDFKPDAVIGTGGYVCFPVLKAASDMHIPTLVHESNAVPGLTTKMLSKYVDRIMLGFEESKQYYPQPEKLTVTGTPVRGEFARFTKEAAKRELGIAHNKPLVVSVWGSLGAGHMNGIISKLIPLMGNDCPFSMIHSAGTGYYSKLVAELDASDPQWRSRGADVREYIYDMPRVMAAADLIMCRAGASTISELSYMGKPVIMVPSPNVTNNHQEKNARVLEKAGGAKVLLEGEFDAESLYNLIKDTLSDKQGLESMSKAMASLAVNDATERICGIIISLCDNNK